MSTTKDIDLSALTDEHLEIVKKVYAFMAMLLDDRSFAELTEDEVTFIHDSISSIKVRDGILKYFSEAPLNIRIDLMKSFTLISETLLDQEEDKELLGLSSMILAAFMLCHAGMKQDMDENRDVDYELKLVDDLIEEAFILDCEASLLKLLKLARTHNVPPAIFYQSLEAITFHHTTDPVGHLND